MLLIQVIQKLEKLFNDANVDPGHGLDHAISVMVLGLRAIASSDLDISEDQASAILLACLLHDADDQKFFHNSQKYENAQKILEGYSEQIKDWTLELIGYVSCSTNGNSTHGLNLPEEEWKLYPRFADRCEALGEIGILRCWLYNLHVKRPLFIESTPRVTTLENLEKVASPERFQNYINLKGKVGKSSMMDHYYDKLYRLIIHPHNKFFQEEFKNRGEPIIKFIFQYGETGQIDEVYLKNLEQKYNIK